MKTTGLILCTSSYASGDNLKIHINTTVRYVENKQRQFSDSLVINSMGL